MAALNFNNVNMTGPIQGQPIDFQTQQAQLQQAQTIAMALLQRGMTPVNPTVDTSPGNPFSRSVPNISGMISQLAGGIQGASQLEDVNKQQTDLGQKILANRMQGVQDMWAPTKTNVDFPTGGGPPTEAEAMQGMLAEPASIPATKVQNPSMIEAAKRALSNSDPYVQSIGMALLKQIGDMAKEQMVKPENIVKGIEFGTPASIASSMEPNAFGYQAITHPERIVPKEQVVLKPQDVQALGTTAGGPTRELSTTGPGAAAPTPTPDVSAPAAAPSAAPAAAPATNIGAADATYSVNKAQAEKLITKDLPEAQIVATGAAKALGSFSQLMDLVAVANTGGPLTDVYKRAVTLAQQLDIKVDATKVNSLHALNALVFMPAVDLVHKLTPRGTQMELNAASGAVGPGEDLTPAGMIKVMNENIANLLNESVYHKQLLEQAAQNPVIQKMGTDALRPFSSFSDPEGLMKSINIKKAPFNVIQDKNGFFHANQEVLDQKFAGNGMLSTQATPSKIAADAQGNKVGLFGNEWKPLP